MSNHGKTIIIGTEKTIKNLSPYYSWSDDVFVVSAYGFHSTAQRGPYYVESCSVIDPRTGSVEDLEPFKNISDLVPDHLYEDIFRSEFTESSVSEFYNTFSGYDLTGSEFAAALTAYTSEQMGYNPWVVIHPDEENLMGFCRDRGWTFTVLGKGQDGTLQNAQEVISGIVSSKGSGEMRLFSSRRN